MKNVIIKKYKKFNIEEMISDIRDHYNGSIDTAVITDFTHDSSVIIITDVSSGKYNIVHPDDIDDILQNNNNFVLEDNPIPPDYRGYILWGPELKSS